MGGFGQAYVGGATIDYENSKICFMGVHCCLLGREMDRGLYREREYINGGRAVGGSRGHLKIGDWYCVCGGGGGGGGGGVWSLSE